MQSLQDLLMEAGLYEYDAKIIAARVAEAAGYTRPKAVFTRETGIPAEVTSVVDVDGDVWTRISGWQCRGAGITTTDELLSNYSPLTEG